MKIKHNKLKNTAIIFECLIKQMTTDLMESDSSHSLNIIKKYFKEGTQLKKELDLYTSIVGTKMKDEVKLVNFIDEVLKVRNNSINNSVLNREKYNIVKEIKDNYILENIFSHNLTNYKLFASIYKLFNGIELNESANSYVNLKFSIIKTIINNKTQQVQDKTEKILVKEDKVIRELATKIMIQKFNEKFSSLTEDQKELLKQYINNAENKNTLKEYVNKIIPSVKSKLLESINGKDKVLKIKIKGIINLLEGIRAKKVIDDSNIISIMKSYELIKELNKR